jgi:hypothetical protein
VADNAACAIDDVGEPFDPYLPCAPSEPDDVLPVAAVLGEPPVRPPVSEPIALASPFVTPAIAPVIGLLPLDDAPAPALVDPGLTLFPDVMSVQIGLLIDLDVV